MTEGEINRASWQEAFAHQNLDSLKRTHDGGFIVDGASSPDECFRNFSTEWVFLPLLFCSGFDRYHIQVACQQNGLQGWIAPLPGIQKTVAPYDLPLQSRVHPGKHIREIGMQISKCFRIERGGIIARYRRKAKRSGEPLRSSLRNCCFHRGPDRGQSGTVPHRAGKHEQYE
jgi:hypothetical protein